MRPEQTLRAAGTDTPYGGTAGPPPEGDRRATTTGGRATTTPSWSVGRELWGLRLYSFQTANVLNFQGSVLQGWRGAATLAAGQFDRDQLSHVDRD